MIVLTTLGAAEILVEDARLTPAAERAFAALLYLCVERGRPVRRATLQAVIFPEGSTNDEAHSLRQLLYKLRKAGAPIATTASTVTLPADAVRDDVGEILARGSVTRAEQAAIRTGVLAGYAPNISQTYAQWLDSHRGSISVQLRRLLVDQIGRARERNDWPALEEAARTCVALDPLNEEATFAKSEALVMVGSKVEAMAVLETYNTDIGAGSPELKLSAAVLRRRISERMPVYMAKPTADVPLVGRQPELERLLKALALIRAGTPRIVRVSGEAGIGKSRLVEEFTKLATLDGARTVVVRAHPSDVRRPLSAFYDAVPRLLALPGALGCAPESMQFLKRFDRLRTPATTAVPEAERDAEWLFANITAAIQDLLAAVASESTVLLVIEDAHWLDDHSTRLVEDALRSRESLALGLVLTLRTERAAGVRAEAAPDLIAIDLEALDRPSCERLVELLLRAPNQAPLALREWLAATAAGSPLYARLLVQHFEATGQAFEVPLSLSSLIALQLDDLSPQARKIVETVTVLGRYATIARLRELLGMQSFEFLLAVQELEDRRLLRQDGEGVRTAHALLDDSVVEKMRPLVASVLHRDVAVLLESEMSAESAHVPWDCARHWQMAGEPERAIAALRMCARQALAVGQPGEACEVLERLGREQSSGSSLRRAIYEELVDVAEATGEWKFVPAAVEHLLEGGSHDPPKRPLSEYFLLRLEALYNTSLDVEAGRQFLNELLGNPAADPSLRVRAATLVVERADVTNDTADLQLAREVMMSLAQLPGNVIPEAALAYFLLVYNTSFGDLDHVPELAERIMELSTESSSPAARARLRMNAGFALFFAGFADRAKEILVEVERDAADQRLPTLQARALGMLCHIALCCDSPTRARGYLSAADVAWTKQGSNAPPGQYSWARAVLLLQEGRFDEAEKWIEDSETRLPGIKTGNAKLATDALRLLIRVENGAPIPVEAISSLVCSYEGAKGTCVDDYVIICIATALARRGDHATSASIAVDYLTKWRRLRIRAPMALLQLADQLK